MSRPTDKSEELAADVQEKAREIETQAAEIRSQWHQLSSIAIHLDEMGAPPLPPGLEQEGIHMRVFRELQELSYKEDEIKRLRTLARDAQAHRDEVDREMSGVEPCTCGVCATCKMRAELAEEPM